MRVLLRIGRRQRRVSDADALALMRAGQRAHEPDFCPAHLDDLRPAAAIGSGEAVASRLEFQMRLAN